MSVCTTCYNAGTIPNCVTEITFGEVTVSTEFNGWIENLSTGRIYGAAVESDLNGIATIEPFTFDVDTSYRLFLTEVDTAPNQTREDITIGEDVYTCIEFEVVQVDGIEIDTVNLTP